MDIMWLSGAPGVGKSAIIQTVCEALSGENSPIHASHFFARGEGDRANTSFLSGTLAYQLCQTTSYYSPAIEKSIGTNPEVLRASFVSQFRKLVIEPAKGRWKYFQKPITIVIDGLDECNSIKDQVALLDLVLEASTTQQIRFLIASRPEQQIHSFFLRDDVARRTVHIRLDEETFNTSQDIIIFLRAEFARIRKEKPELCPDLPNGEAWPGEDVIHRLATDSDAQFIFAVLAISYVDTNGHSPNQQLQRLLKALCPGAFSALDILYAQILSRCPDNFAARSPESEQYGKTVMDILQVVLSWPVKVTAAGIAAVLSLEVDDVQSIVSGPMRCLFNPGKHGQDVYVAFVHKSLPDYLLDSKRSGDFHIPSDQPDALFLRILSRQPHVSRRAVSGILLAVVSRPFLAWTTTPEIAAVLDVDPSVVEGIIRGPMRPLFSDPDVLPTQLFHDSFKVFLLDSHRSGEYYIPSTEPDALFLQILSRQLPPTRELATNILAIVKDWPFSWKLTGPEIADVLNVEPNVVQDVICGSLRALFHHLSSWSSEPVAFFHWSLPGFLSDPTRSGSFFIPDAKPDPFFVKLLSKQPSVQAPFSREDLIGVMAIILVGPQSLTSAQIARLLDVHPDIVRNVIDGPQRMVFYVNGDGSVQFKDTGFMSEFLLNADRSREFSVPSSTIDAICRQFLAQPLPIDWTRDVLMGILYAIVAHRDSWRICMMTTRGFALMLDVEPDVVSAFIKSQEATFIRVFRVNSVFICIDDGNSVFTTFLRDRSRAGDFWVDCESARYQRISSYFEQHPKHRTTYSGPWARKNPSLEHSRAHYLEKAMASE